MKNRIITLLLAFVMLFSFTSGMTATASDDCTYILLRPGNFTLPALDSSGKGWKVQNDQDKYQNAIPGGYLWDNTFSEGAKASFYVTEEGSYVVWAMTVDPNPGTRYGYVSVDGESDENKFGGSEENAFTWSRSKKAFNLAPGLHTITLTTGFPSFFCSAVMITNDLELELDENTAYDDIAKYADTQAPTFSGSIDAVEKSASSFTATFPSATDNIGIAEVKYYVNDVPVTVGDDLTYTATDVTPLRKYTLKATAFDALGNTAETTAELDLSHWKIASVVIKNTAKDEIDSLGELTSTDTKFSVEVQAEKLTAASEKVRLFIGVFSDKGRMLYFKRLNVSKTGKSTASFSSLTADFLEQSNSCSLRVILVDTDANISAVTEGTVIESEAGAK